MDLNLCCFIPGKVLDELTRLLDVLITSKGPLKPNNLLQELRDISSMAIEHFDDRIVSTLRNLYKYDNEFYAINENMYNNNKNIVQSNGTCSNSSQNSSSVSFLHGGGLRSLAFSTMTAEIPDSSPDVSDTLITQNSIKSTSLKLPHEVNSTLEQNAGNLNSASTVQMLGTNNNNCGQIAVPPSTCDPLRPPRYYMRPSRKMLHQNACSSYNHRFCKYRNFINSYKKLKLEHNRALRKVLLYLII